MFDIINTDRFVIAVGINFFIEVTRKLDIKNTEYLEFITFLFTDAIEHFEVVDNLGNNIQTLLSLISCKFEDDFSLLSDFEYSEYENLDFIIYFSDNNFKTKHNVINSNNFKQLWQILSKRKIINTTKSTYDNFEYKTFWEKVLKGLDKFNNNWAIFVDKFTVAKSIQGKENELREEVKEQEDIDATLKNFFAIQDLLKVKQSIVIRGKDGGKTGFLSKANEELRKKFIKIYSIKKDHKLHDRVIITNLFIIRSLHSFDYIIQKKNGDYILLRESSLIITSLINDYISFRYYIEKYKKLIT